MISQVDLVRRRLVDPRAIDVLWMIPRWQGFNRETIADAIVICSGDPVMADQLCIHWRQDTALSERAHRLPEHELLDYMRRHASGECTCASCQRREATP